MFHKKKRRREEEISFGDRLSGVLQLPVNVVEGLPQMEVMGNKEAVIEGCDGVLEYNENVVRLSTGKLVIKFMGRGLILKCMTDTGVIVTGYITSIEFF